MKTSSRGQAVPGDRSRGPPDVFRLRRSARRGAYRTLSGQENEPRQRFFRGQEEIGARWRMFKLEECRLWLLGISDAVHVTSPRALRVLRGPLHRKPSVCSDIRRIPALGCVRVSILCGKIDPGREANRWTARRPEIDGVWIMGRHRMARQSAPAEVPSHGCVHRWTSARKTPRNCSLFLTFPPARRDPDVSVLDPQTLS
jgi:hypothetical protein